MKQFCRWTGNEKHVLFCLSLSAAHNFCGAQGEASHFDIASTRPWLYEEKYQKLILKAHSRASWMYAAANVEKISAWMEPDVNASLLFLTCSQLILTFSMFLTLSLPAKRPRPMIGKGITKGTKKQSTLICSGDVTRVQYVSHSKCADGQVAIRRTIRLGDSANSFLERERVCLCFTSGMN